MDNSLAIIFYMLTKNIKLLFLYRDSEDISMCYGMYKIVYKMYVQNLKEGNKRKISFFIKE